MSRLCEWFSCLPSEAERELERNEDLVWRIVDYRRYAQTYHEFKTSKAEDAINPNPGSDPMLDLVWAFVEEDFKRRKAQIETDDEDDDE